MITSKKKPTKFISVATTEMVGSSLNSMTREKIFLQKMKTAEEAIARGEYMTSAQAHEFLGV